MLAPAAGVVAASVTGYYADEVSESWKDNYEQLKGIKADFKGHGNLVTAVNQLRPQLDAAGVTKNAQGQRT
jgi:hypothetical protein